MTSPLDHEEDKILRDLRSKETRTKRRNRILQISAILILATIYSCYCLLQSYEITYQVKHWAVRILAPIGTLGYAIYYFKTESSQFKHLRNISLGCASIILLTSIIRLFSGPVIT